MPGLRDIKRRITSVEKTQQITRAMRMVAAAKLGRAQNAIVAARPYAERMRETLQEVARSQRDAAHPLLAVREPTRKLELLLITSDRGLCGAFNHNVLRRADEVLERREPDVEEISLTLVGRKAVDYHRRRRADQIGKTYTALGNIAYSHAEEIAAGVIQRYTDAEVDEVILVHGEFVSALTQAPREVRLLPQELVAPVGVASTPFSIEPSAEKLLAVLVPRAVEFEVYRALLDNQASEHAARMAAMEAATRNTQEMIERLTLQFNRARQAAITKELVEIVTGAEALHG